MQDVAGYHNIQSLLGFPRIFLFIFYFKKIHIFSVNIGNIHEGEPSLTPNNLTSFVWHLHPTQQSALMMIEGWTEHFPSLPACLPSHRGDLWSRWEKDKDKTVLSEAEFKIVVTQWYLSREDFFLLSRIFVIRFLTDSAGLYCRCFLILLTSSSCIEITSCSKIRAGPQYFSGNNNSKSV